VLGNPAALFIAKDPQVQQIQEMVSQLEKKLQAEPSNVDGWMFLGRSYAAMNRLTEAKMAYQKAISLDPKNDNLLADLADLTAFQSKSINAEALEYLNQALTINPKNPKALALRGSAAFDQKNYAAAIKDWTLAVAVLDPKDQEFISGLKNSIQEAQDLLKKNNSSAITKMSSDILAGKVSVTGKLLTQVSPTDTVFIYARAANGPRMPLAIIRFTANELPRSFELNDSQAMSPQMSLSKFNTLTIIARVSKSGNATPQTGDLIGEIENVPLGTKNITLVIDKIQP
jgi:cytochrome c-type biogenesis protein CcmH